MWVMRSAMKPAGTKSEGRNLVFIRLIPFVETSTAASSKLHQN
jgi:hypothetical protein